MVVRNCLGIACVYLIAIFMSRINEQWSANHESAEHLADNDVHRIAKLCAHLHRSVGGNNYGLKAEHSPAMLNVAKYGAIELDNAGQDTPQMGTNFKMAYINTPSKGFKPDSNFGTRNGFDHLGVFPKMGYTNFGTHNSVSAVLKVAFPNFGTRNGFITLSEVPETAYLDLGTRNGP